jgi:tetratricopeptide (TPR) repeat protein
VAQGLDTTLTLKQLEQVEGMLDESTLDAENELYLSETLAMAYAPIGQSQKAYTFGMRAIGMLEELEPGPSLRRLKLLDLVVRSGLQLDVKVRDGGRLKAMSQEAITLSEALLPPDAVEWFEAVYLDWQTPPNEADGFVGLYERAERVLGLTHPTTLELMRREAEQMQSAKNPGAVELVELARRRAVGKYGEQSPLAHIGLSRELLVHFRAGASHEALLALIDERLPKAREILGERHPTVVRTLFNKASVLMAAGRYSEAIKVLESARIVEIATRGSESILANWFAATLAIAHLRTDNWEGYLREEANLNTEPKKSNLAPQMLLELSELTALRGEKARASAWLSPIDGSTFPQAELLRRKYNLE